MNGLAGFLLLRGGGLRTAACTDRVSPSYGWRRAISDEARRRCRVFPSLWLFLLRYQLVKLYGEGGCGVRELVQRALTVMSGWHNAERFFLLPRFSLSTSWKYCPAGRANWSVNANWPFGLPQFWVPFWHCDLQVTAVWQQCGTSPLRNMLSVLFFTSKQLLQCAQLVLIV